MKTLKAVWIYGWAYAFIIAGLICKMLDRIGDWLADQVDHNDYLAGFVFGICLFALPYIVGIIDIVVRG